VFKNPVRVGGLVILHGRLIFTSRSSMEVLVEVEMEDLRNGEKIPALSARFVMVALNASGKAVQVQPLIISTEEEEKLYNEAKLRYDARKKG